MYKKHFGLLRKPFELTSDIDTLFLGETHKEAMAVLKHGVVSDKGFLLFTGGVGTGKTTLITVLAKTLENPGYLCLLSNPTLEVGEFFHYFAAKLGLLYDGNQAKFLCLFAKLLEECKKTNNKVLLIIDEAHALPTDLLEELRLLVNMSSEVEGVLSVFLVGQPELLERLSGEQLSHLSKRIAVRHRLEQLSRQDALQYIKFRLKRAGAKEGHIFTEKALALIYKATGGNPRQINILCDTALFNAFSNEQAMVDDKIIRKSVAQLHIDGDDAAYYLPAEKTRTGRWFVLGAGAVLGIEIITGVYVYRNDLWQPLFNSLKGMLGLG